MTIVPWAFGNQTRLDMGVSRNHGRLSLCAFLLTCMNMDIPLLDTLPHFGRLNLGFSSRFNIFQAPFELLHTLYTSRPRLQSTRVRDHPSVNVRSVFMGAGHQTRIKVGLRVGLFVVRSTRSLRPSRVDDGSLEAVAKGFLDISVAVKGDFVSGSEVGGEPRFLEGNGFVVLF